MYARSQNVFIHIFYVLPHLKIDNGLVLNQVQEIIISYK